MAAHRLHEAAHALLAFRAERGNDFGVGDACAERLVRDLEFAAVDAEAGERAAETQAAQAVLPGLLESQCLDSDICAAVCEPFDFCGGVALRRIQHDIDAHSPGCGRPARRYALRSSTTSTPIRWANTRRCGSGATPITSAAPIRRAPIAAHKPIGSSANTATASPMRTCDDSAPLNPVGGDVCQQHHLLVGQVIGDSCQIRSVRHPVWRQLALQDRTVHPPQFRSHAKAGCAARAGTDLPTR